MKKETIKLTTTTGREVSMFLTDIEDVIKGRPGIKTKDVYRILNEKVLRFYTDYRELTDESFKLFRKSVQRARERLKIQRSEEKLVVLFKTESTEPIRVNYNDIVYALGNVTKLNKLTISNMWKEIMFGNGVDISFNELTEMSKERFTDILEEEFYNR